MLRTAKAALCLRDRLWPMCEHEFLPIDTRRNPMTECIKCGLQLGRRLRMDWWRRLLGGDWDYADRLPIAESRN